MTQQDIFQQFQPRYLAYCKAHGKTPEEMNAHDDEAYPGGCMTGYIAWIMDKWSEWDKVTGHRGAHDNEDHKAFDVWLEKRVAE